MHKLRINSPLLGVRHSLGLGLGVLLGSLALACEMSERAGTVLVNAGDGATSQAGSGGAGGSPSTASDGSAGASGEGILQCEDFPTWIDFAHYQLVLLPESNPVTEANLLVERLLVDSNCQYLVQHLGTSTEIRSGWLDAATKTELWAALGSDARAGFSGLQNALAVGEWRQLADPNAPLICLGECSAPAVASEVEALFETASAWVTRLYGEGAPLAGSLVVYGFPLVSASETALPWPLETPLAEYFAGGAWNDLGIEPSAEEALLLREAVRSAATGNLISSMTAIFVDESDTLYLVRLEESAAELL